jgi:uncharacterized protein
MSESDPQQLGRIAWLDLTAPNAVELRGFYQEVAGWTPSSVAMGDYEDFCMIPRDGADPVAGICHARGANVYLPAVWLPYINVVDLDASLASCEARGGKKVGDIRGMGASGRYCVIQDPAGAYAALFEPAG